MTPRPGRTRKGRTALTPDVQKRICDALLLGSDLESAAEYGGISYETYRQWMKRGEQGERPFAAFHAATKKAASEAVVRHLVQIEDAASSRTIPCKGVVQIDGTCEVCATPYHAERRCRQHFEVPGQWTAAAWKLERRYPQHYGQRQHVEVETSITGENLVELMKEPALAVVAAGVTDEQRELIRVGWSEIARKRGVLPAATEDELAEERRVRARQAQPRLPGIAP